MPLTDSKLRAVRPNGTRYELPDRQGLALRVGSTGSMVWTLTYTVRGPAPVPGGPAPAATPPTKGERRRLNIGSYPEMSLSEAREQALKLRRGARNGADPRAAETEAAVPISPQVVTVADLIDRYAREHLHRNLASGGGVERLLRRHVEPRWGSRTIADLVATDLVDLLEIIRVPAGVVLAARGREQRFAAIRGGRGSAAEVRKWVRAMFQFAAAVGMLPANPFREVRNRDRLRPRDRVLSMDELAAIWRATGRMYYPWGALFRLLLLTGNRRGEWADARWDWLDAAATQLEIPASAYKTARVHVVPFSVQVAALVRGLPRPEFGPYLLSSSGGMHAVSGFSKAKGQLDDLVAMDLGAGPLRPWVIHDLRRSMATHMERLGVLPHIIEACLGHALKGVAGTYRHFSFLEEKRAALQRWADAVELHVHPVQIAAE